MRLPRNGKEFTLFLGIISILSVNIIAPLITMFEIGFSLEAWRATYQVMPIIWVFVIIFVLLTHQRLKKWQIALSVKTIVLIQK